MNQRAFRWRRKRLTAQSDEIHDQPVDEEAGFHNQFWCLTPPPQSTVSSVAALYNYLNKINVTESMKEKSGYVYNQGSNSVNDYQLQTQ